MRHKKDKRKLGRNSSHRKAFLRNMVRNVMLYEKIETTAAKAKEAKRLVDKVITLGKDETLSNKRRVYDVLQDHALTSRVFKEIAPRFKKRAGGYTRIYALKTRAGDGAELVYLSLVELRAKTASKATKKKETLKPKEEVKQEPAQEVKEVKKEKPEVSKVQKPQKEEKKKVDKEKGPGFFKNLRTFLGKSKRPDGS